MKKELKKAWVAALKSKEYEQGTGALCKSNDVGDKFCCLGVLCEVARKNPDLWLADSKVDMLSKETVGVNSYVPQNYQFTVGDKIMGNHEVLPGPIAGCLGLRTEVDGHDVNEQIYVDHHTTCSVSDGRLVDILMSLNDDEGLCFEIIADVVDKFVPETP